MSLIGKLAQMVVQLGVVVGQAFIQAYHQAAASTAGRGARVRVPGWREGGEGGRRLGGIPPSTFANRSRRPYGSSLVLSPPRGRPSPTSCSLCIVRAEGSLFVVGGRGLGAPYVDGAFPVLCRRAVCSVSGAAVTPCACARHCVWAAPARGGPPEAWLVCVSTLPLRAAGRLTTIRRGEPRVLACAPRLLPQPDPRAMEQAAARAAAASASGMNVLEARQVRVLRVLLWR
jgi:hypothetical protein